MTKREFSDNIKELLTNKVDDATMGEVSGSVEGEKMIEINTISKADKTNRTTTEMMIIDERNAVLSRNIDGSTYTIKLNSDRPITMGMIANTSEMTDKEFILFESLFH